MPGAAWSASRPPVAGLLPPFAADGSLPPPVAAPLSNMSYHGGPVMRSSTAYAIYWTPPGTTMSSTYRSFVDAYFTNVAAASGTAGNVYANDTQYSDTTGRIAYAGGFGGSYVDTANAIPDDCSVQYAVHGLTVSGCVTQQDLADEVDRVLAAAGWTPGLNKLFFVFTPPSVGSCFDSANGCAYLYYCAYHTYSGTNTIWANIPFPRLSKVPGYTCDAGIHPNGNPDGDAVVSMISHEHIEAITDPLLTGWWDDTNGYAGEIADKCAWNFGAAIGSTPQGAYNQQIGTGKYRLQQEWSNASTGCVQRRPAPVLTSFSPSSAPVGGTVTLNGSRLSPVTHVSFGVTPASFSHVSAARLVATVPAGAATAAITVASDEDSAASAAAFKVAPAISGLSKATGQAGDPIVITGTTLTGATSVAFGAVADPGFSVDSAGQITAHVPDTATLGPVTVTTPGGTATRSFAIRPRIDAVSPGAAEVGKLVTLDGKTLAGVTRVVFGSPKALGSIRSRTATRLTVTVPATAVTGKLTATNAAGGGDSPAVFTVLPSKITSFSPLTGVAGTPVSIAGTGLANTTGVFFGGVSAPIVSKSATKVVATVPPTAPVGAITVTTAEGPPTPLAKPFKPVPKLSVPAGARVGDQAALAGTNLAGATKLTLGTLVLGFHGATATQITTDALPDAALTGALRVVTPGGTSAPVTLGIRPTIASFTPPSGHPGDKVTINGKTLRSPTKVTFTGGAAARILSSTATQVVVTVPAAALSGPITVTNTGGSTPSAASFSLLPSPNRSSRPG